jgi:drug/metabolite transporter (DMT)-like permease
MTRSAVDQSETRPVAPVVAGVDAAAVPTSGWVALMPAVFVILWASGFVGAKYGLPSAPPASFLLWRFLLVLAVLVPMALLARAPWPSSRRQLAHLAVVGVLVQAGYLGGVFHAIDHGISAGLVALIVGLQPVLTAVLAGVFLRERVRAVQWVGLVLGLIGAALVVEHRLSVDGLTLGAFLLSLVALFSMTLGTLYQKRFCPQFDLRTGAIVQFAAATLIMVPLALQETRPVLWTPVFIAAMLWLVVALSIVAIALLALLVRRGATTKVASLFYLVPPTTALMAFAAFGERLTGLALIGMALTAMGVALVVRS